MKPYGGGRYELAMAFCLNGKCSGSLIRKRIRSPDLRISEIFVSENQESCYSLGSTSDDENPLWPCSPRNPDAACRARRRRAEASNARGRLSQIAEAARPSSALAAGRRTAARGLLNARLRERDAAVQASGSRRRLGGSENIPPCKPLKTKETELGSRQILPRSEEADATVATVSSNQKEAQRRVHPRRRSREIGGPADAGSEIFLSANP